MGNQEDRHRESSGRHTVTVSDCQAVTLSDRHRALSAYWQLVNEIPKLSREEIQIRLLELLNGEIPCPTCEGEGDVTEDVAQAGDQTLTETYACPDCDGTGLLRNDQIVDPAQYKCRTCCGDGLAKMPTPRDGDETSTLVATAELQTIDRVLTLAMDALESDADLDARREAFEAIQELYEPPSALSRVERPGDDAPVHLQGWEGVVRPEDCPCGDYGRPGHPIGKWCGQGPTPLRGDCSARDLHGSACTLDRGHGGSHRSTSGVFN